MTARAHIIQSQIQIVLARAQWWVAYANTPANLARVVQYGDGRQLTHPELVDDAMSTANTHLHNADAMIEVLMELNEPISPIPAEEPVIDPGKGWRLLVEGELLKPGDGLLHPDCGGTWIDYHCRPDIFRGSSATGCPAKEWAHTWPWRRKIEIGV